MQLLHSSFLFLLLALLLLLLFLSRVFLSILLSLFGRKWHKKSKKHLSLASLRQCIECKHYSCHVLCTKRSLLVPLTLHALTFFSPFSQALAGSFSPNQTICLVQLSLSYQVKAKSTFGQQYQAFSCLHFSFFRLSLLLSIKLWLSSLLDVFHGLQRKTSSSHNHLD